MGIKTNLQILAEITGKILTGGRRTTAVNTRSVLTDLADSSLNKKDGGLVVEALTGYATDLTPTDDNHFASKKYVDDNGGTVPDATETVKGKVELVSDVELDSATPPDNTATTPTLSPIALSLRGVYLLWKKIYSYFTDRNSSQITVFANNGGSGNTFVANGSPAFSGNLPTKLILTFSQVAGYVPTGTSTLNVDGIGAVPLLRQDASNLQNGDIVGGHRYIAVYAPVFGYLLQGVGITSSGSTNLGYTASPTNGIVTSDTGTDATIPLADATNAGLLKPAKYTVLENTTGTNTGDETTATIKTKLGIASGSQDGYLTSGDWTTFNNKVSKSGDTMTGRLNLAQGADIASASTTDLSNATGNSVKITGSTTINSFGTVTAGAMLWLTFDSVLTITHSDNIVLENSQNIITARGDKAVFISKGGGVWELALYSKATGFPVNERPNMFFARGHVVNAFGSSHFVGTGSTSADRGVIRQFEQTSGCTVNNLAVSGAGIYYAIKEACTVGSYLYAVDQVFDAIAEAGFNDAIRTLGSPRSGFTPAANNNARTYAKIEDGWDTFIANYFCKSGIAASAAGAVKTGTWSAAPNGGNWISKAETNFGGTGMSTVTSGDKITYTMTAGNGRRVAIWLGTNSISAESGETYGSVSVTLNGTTVHSNVSLNERTIATANYPVGHYDNKYGVKVLLVDTYGSGVSTNVIEIISNGGGKIIVDSILELKRASKAPQLIVNMMPFLNTAGYTTQSDGVTLRDYIASDELFSIANGYIDRAINKYPEYNIVRVDPNKYIRDANLSSDNVHGNDIWHKDWNKAIMEKVAYDTNDYQTIRLLLTGAGGASPADATNYYLSDNVSGTPSPTDTSRRYRFQRAFKCEGIRITTSGVSSSSEQSSLFLRKNGATVGSAITTTLDLSGGSVMYIIKEDIDVTFERLDEVNVMWATPTWVTNPTQVTMIAELIGKFV
jgi:hypothetical protein